MELFAIAVIETTAVVSNVNPRQSVPVLNVVVETESHVRSLVRYIPDLIQFDQMIKSHYHKIKIPFPTLMEPLTMAEKRKSLKHFLSALSQTKHKTNAEKLERYLRKCSLDPVIRSSTIFRDFFAVQRDEDYVISKFAERNNPHIADQREKEEEEEVVEEREENVGNETLAVVPILKSTIVAPKPAKTHPLDQLEKIKVLGKGCMGKVFLVRSRSTDELYALKSIMKELVIEQREITHTLAEREILATVSGINHPFLAKLHMSFQDTHRLYLVTDYYCGGDLATQMSTCCTFPKERTLFYAAEIIEGIGELHRLGVLYRDLKPENILLTLDGHVILTDFGLSKWLTPDDPHTQTFCGTAEYLAPEVLLGEPYSFGIDHWSYGTILYEMLAGITPFWADNHADMYRRVLEDPLEFPPDVDYETAEFLCGLLDRDPRTRLGAAGVDEIKSHPYFAGIAWEDVYHRRLPPPYVPPLTSALDFSNFDNAFLDMPPTLTPVGSATDLTAISGIDHEDVQHVFDGYAFVAENYLDEHNMQLPDGCAHPMDDPHQRPTDPAITFPPARKRGSISMLSDVESFHLDQPPREPTTTVRFGKDEQARYAKRRNTGASEYLDPTRTNATMHTVPDLSLSSLDEPTFDELEFGTPDLEVRLSFSVDLVQKCGNQLAVDKSLSPNPTKKTHRRFFAPFVKA
ncbi:hypothetical protein DFQ28_010300 [Apophysomyces sp. BC1034]|nr:hypothetical protein DFQ30_003731 [Apophysomyces sp. BC1015]KAG0171484.1 hypothetical protein DFQ29_008827 [Apophysomyces sp. BC1021]KAG0184870.1 hypothetical protein DFQ28_010300 [Apophysomyces sp. BC1034]